MRSCAGQLDVGQVARGSGGRCSISAACAAVRVCSVVRSPPRASSTASAVPNEPAPITVARRARGDSERTRGARPAGWGGASG